MNGSELVRLINDPSSGPPEIADALNRASPEERRRSVHSLRRGEQRALYTKLASSKPTTLADLVPAARAPLEAVHHAGRNTLPVARPLQNFEKRFCRSGTDPKQLFGYNAYVLLRVIGPGFFVAEETTAGTPWAARGGVVVDYERVPTSRVPADWPRVVPNSEGLQRFVYRGTRDFLRTASSHVTIGAAFKGEKALDHYFVLVREE